MKNTCRPGEKIIPRALKSSIDLGLNRRNYGQFRLILILVITIIIAGPVVNVAGLGYYYYKDLLQKERTRSTAMAARRQGQHQLKRLLPTSNPW